MKKTYIQPKAIVTIMDMEESVMVRASQYGTNTVSLDNDDKIGDGDELEEFLGDGGDIDETFVDGLGAKSHGSWSDWD